MFSIVKKSNKIFKFLRKPISDISSFSNPEEFMKNNQKFSKINQNSNKNENENRLFENDLAWGEIPIELSFERQTSVQTLTNGITVAHTDYISPIVTISVFIKCGSANEREKASGVAHFLEHMHFKGTQKRTRDQISVEIENKGGQLNAYTSRDYTSYILNIPDDNVEWGVEFLSDILTNSIYNLNLLEQEKNTIQTELFECTKEEFETILENSHMTAFKGHAMAKPILGLIENIKSVQREQIIEFHKLNFYGENLFFVTAGNVEHKSFCGLVEKYFGKWPAVIKSNDKELLEQLKPPVFSPRVSFINGPEGSLKIGVMWKAPSFGDSEYFAFLIIQRLIGDYEVQKFRYSETKIALSDVSYFLSNNEKINKFKSGFMPYRSSGLFGCYIEGNETECAEMVTFVIAFLHDLKYNIRDEDVAKVRSNLFSELMMIESGNDLSQDIGTYLINTGRDLGKSEMAKRISLASNTEYLREILDEWILSQPYTVTFWGPLDEIKVGPSFYLRK